MMTDKYTLIRWATLALLLCNGNASQAEENDVEQSTASPITDMALVDTHKVNDAVESMDNKQQLSMSDSAQPHTIADFIIHPLIALKPRHPEEPFAEGKQAETTTTPAPWQLFGFNPAQGIGSSVSTIADTVSGWLGTRIPLPGLVDTPVRELLSTTTTSTTPRPDVVVRVEHGSSTRRPLIQIGNEPDRYNNDHNDYDEYPEDEEYDYAYDTNSDRNFQNSIRNHGDDEDDGEYDFEDDLPRDEEEDVEDVEDEEDEEEELEEEEEEDERPVRKTKPNNRRRRPAEGTSNRRGTNNRTSQKKRPANKQGNRYQKRRRPQNSQEDEEEEEQDEEYDNEVEEEDDYDEQNNEEDERLNDSSSTKRSQNQHNFMRRGQQSLISQIRQMTRGHSPAELSSNIRKGVVSTNSKKRRQQATLIINRNGQTIYIAPDLMKSSNLANQNAVTTTSSSNTKKRPAAGYPKPPLASSHKRKGKPTQYITIPWNQLGISPPTKLVSVTEGVQTQPLILNIPQSALDAMQGNKPAKKQTVLTSEAVPLLAEASLMDVFKPPQIPHTRTPSPVKITKTNASMTPLLISTKAKQRVRPGTIVEKSPAMDSSNEKIESSTENSYSLSNESEGGQYILVGEDTEDGLARHAIPILGEPRHFTPLTPYFNFFHSRQYKTRSGRQTKQTEKESTSLSHKDIKTESELPKQTNSNGREVVMRSTNRAAAGEESSSLVDIGKPGRPAFKEPSIETPKSVTVPTRDIPIVKSRRQVVPVHVITSRLDDATVSQEQVKGDRTKSE